MGCGSASVDNADFRGKATAPHPGGGAQHIPIVSLEIGLVCLLSRWETRCGSLLKSTHSTAGDLRLQFGFQPGVKDECSGDALQREEARIHQPA
eukprot:6012486-Amphidinium_carterae.1